MTEYTISNGTLRYNDNVISVNDNDLILNGVTVIDFNRVQKINVDLDLRDSKVEFINFKNVIIAKNIILPKDCAICEDLYWADSVEFIDTKKPNYYSSRLNYLSIYDLKNKPLVYLSGTVVGYLELRSQQRKLINAASLGCYSPGNHMTLGDKVADKYPEVVYDIDIKAMEAAEIIFFDLNNLSAGTCAELGYSIASGWHKTKRLVGIYKPTQNFFINGLVKHIELFDSLEDFLINYKGGKINGQ